MENLEKKFGDEEQTIEDSDKMIKFEITGEEMKFLRNHGVPDTDYVYIPVFKKAGIVQNIEEYVAVSQWPNFSDLKKKLNTLPLNEGIKYLRALGEKYRSHEK